MIMRLLWDTCSPLLFLVFIVETAYAETAQEIYRQTEKQVMALEVRGKNDEIISYQTALLIEQGKVASQCDLIGSSTSLRLHQGSASYHTEIAQQDVVRNLCILRVDGIGEQPLKLRESYPQVGEKVYALSNALDLGISISQGIVSGIREDKGDKYIQFTASIAPGSEGGGLFDAAGRLIGVINYRLLDGQNVNFAVPAQWINEVEQRAATTNNAETWRTQATVLKQDSKWQELSLHASKWATALADSTEALQWLSVAQENLKAWPDMESTCRKLLLREPSDTYSMLKLSLALAQQAKKDEALEAARSALRYRSEDAQIWLVVGHLERAVGHMEEAKKAYNQVAKLWPWSREAFVGLVDIARSQGDWPAALTAQRQIVSISPKDSMAWLVLAQVYMWLDRPERALSSAEKSIEADSTNGDAWLVKGRMLGLIKRQSEAIVAIKKGLTLKPQHPAWGWDWLGQVYYGLGIYPEAIAAYREALRLEPLEIAYQKDLGITLKDGMQLPEALDIFMRLKEAYPSDQFAWRQIGFVYSNMAQSDKAIPALEKSIAIDYKQPKVWAVLMEQYHAAGRREDVQRAYTRLAELDRRLADELFRKLLFPYGVAP